MRSQRRRALLVLLAVFLLLGACTPPADPGEQEEGFPIYFLDPKEAGGDCIRASQERLSLPENAGLQETACRVVERLLEGPEADGTLNSPLPPGLAVELLSLEIQDQRAYVDLSGAFNQLSGIDLALADYCLTLSLTALEGIGAVSITAQGRAVGQQPKQIFYERDVLLSDMDDVLQTVQVTLYFQGSGGVLVGETRLLSLYEGQTVAESLVAALLEGPENRDLTRVIPEGFAVSYVRVDSGVCYVSLPAASLELLPEEEEAQRRILWSLADSLYSLEAVEELRLLADGEELNQFGEIPVETVAVRPKG